MVGTRRLELLTSTVSNSVNEAFTAAYEHVSGPKCTLGNAKTLYLDLRWTHDWTQKQRFERGSAHEFEAITNNAGEREISRHEWSSALSLERKTHY